MTVGKISSARLAAVFANLSDGQSQAKPKVEAKAETESYESVSEAVTLSKGIKPQEADRTERKEKIKELVASGEYFTQVKTEDVARSVILNLFS